MKKYYKYLIIVSLLFIALKATDYIYLPVTITTDAGFLVSVPHNLVYGLKDDVGDVQTVTVEPAEGATIQGTQSVRIYEFNKLYISGDCENGYRYEIRVRNIPSGDLAIDLYDKDDKQIGRKRASILLPAFYVVKMLLEVVLRVGIIAVVLLFIMRWRT